tara:strand:- start:3430 stop:3798 length:369 start_codon:yes stop_codon:yes gene_type:complete
MATQALNLSLNLNTADTVSGIFSLNSTVLDTVNFDNTDVESKSMSIPTSATEIIPNTAADTYIFIQNTDLANFVTVQDVANNTYAKLFPGSFMFLCCDGGEGLELISDTAACVVNYAKFKKV